MNAIDFNQNISQCIRTQASWGHDVFFNICNHTQTYMPWGGMHYVGATVDVLAVTAAVGIFASFAYMFVAEAYDHFKYNV